MKKYRIWTILQIVIMLILSVMNSYAADEVIKDEKKK
jgi:hypothetical protein